MTFVGSKSEIAQRHLDVCRGFTSAVLSVDGRWDAPTPCEGWDARALLEHVIGLHDVLLLGPVGAIPARPHGVPTTRWVITEEALRQALTHQSFMEGAVDVERVDGRTTTEIVITSLVEALTRNVVVHTWDLARAVGADDELDPELCQDLVDGLPIDIEVLAESGLFAPAVPIDPNASAQEILLSRLGRDPHWEPPPSAFP